MAHPGARQKRPACSVKRLTGRAGCIAVHDEALREIWEEVDDGTPIEILP